MPNKYAFAAAAADMLRMLASSVKADPSSRIDERSWAEQGEALAMGLDKMASRAVNSPINLSSDQLENLSSDQRAEPGPGGASISRPWGMGPVLGPRPPAEPTFSETHHHQTDELAAPAEPTFSETQSNQKDDEYTDGRLVCITTGQHSETNLISADVPQITHSEEQPNETNAPSPVVSAERTQTEKVRRVRKPRHK